MICDHALYEDGDADIPKGILDRNGQVVLAMCKKCHKAEIELDEPELCPYCGCTVVNPCDEPPPDTCEKALNATYGT